MIHKNTRVFKNPFSFPVQVNYSITQLRIKYQLQRMELIPL
jgi:hypothetical protein